MKFQIAYLCGLAAVRRWFLIPTNKLKFVKSTVTVDLKGEEEGLDWSYGATVGQSLHCSTGNLQSTPKAPKGCQTVSDGIVLVSCSQVFKTAKTAETDKNRGHALFFFFL